ncbi:NAD(P)-dependent dehydrogenase (short-subunit alcohol dehydrogenase family) [Kineococcus xinjiangensis]|uniref:NAD(P)-dependent dehydrogenase (Short-subunit alcohol dehydrogenase family) n=1 Tax=Kineococcus xinjiangensis TaxID=512762 RepID=A0A2S6ITL7_9ACTN|nr:oxidoreductase [Kineococcus xinjiangensis]PPK97597.1 NAD(P)-dependent dehydrogenase (short-subunit alcohol dehydrogenase family) [Kineococcus xinjiangensis]
MDPEKHSWYVPDQSGRTALVTGANGGLGYHVSLELARAGARVLLACRNAERGEEALRRLRAELEPSGAPVAAELLQVDVADLTSVRRAAAEVAERAPVLDVLVNNAGIMATPRWETPDGFEGQLATNHLGHFALTGLLLPSLLAAPHPRVVSVASIAHWFGRLKRGDLMWERNYSPWAVYGQSKLANLLFASELQRRARAARTPLLSLAAHPGISSTELFSVGPRMSGSRAWKLVQEGGMRLVAQHPAQGARPLLRAATDPSVAGGEYFGPDGPFGLRGDPRRTRAMPWARDAEGARWLWERSAELTGVDYAQLQPEDLAA